jgi:DNA-binding NarL/FixJ family response regulator
VDVFVVEDSAPMRHRVVEALEELPGVRVVGVAEGADEAVPAIKRLKPRFVVLDLKLAQGSGLFVLETIKHLDPPPVVAVLTNYPHEQYRARCAEMGADFFFDKAAGLDGLLEACRRAAGVAEDQGACA